MVKAKMALSLAIFDQKEWMHSCTSITSVSAQDIHNHQHTSTCAPSLSTKENSTTCFWPRSFAQESTRRVPLLQALIQHPSPDRQPRRTLYGLSSSVKMEGTLLLVDKTESFAYGRCCQTRRSVKCTRKTRVILPGKQNISAHRSFSRSLSESTVVIPRQYWI